MISGKLDKKFVRLHHNRKKQGTVASACHPNKARNVK
jgi:hypothetical protein